MHWRAEGTSRGLQMMDRAEFIDKGYADLVLKGYTLDERSLRIELSDLYTSYFSNRGAMPYHLYTFVYGIMEDYERSKGRIKRNLPAWWWVFAKAQTPRRKNI